MLSVDNPYKHEVGYEDRCVSAMQEIADFLGIKYSGVNVDPADVITKLQTLEQGRVFQDFVVKYLHERGIVLPIYSSKQFQYKFGEGPDGWEIKNDVRMNDTGRVSIEVEKINPRGWRTRAAIFRGATKLIHGTDKCFFVFDVATLLPVIKRKVTEEKLLPDGSTLRKRYLSFEEALDIAEAVVLDRHGVKGLDSALTARAQ
jgi:hypothetical protein